MGKLRLQRHGEQWSPDSVPSWTDAQIYTLNCMPCCPLTVPWEWPPGCYLLGVDSGLRLPQLHLMVVLPLGSESEPAFFLSCITAMVVDILGRNFPITKARKWCKPSPSGRLAVRTRTIKAPGSLQC